MAGNDFGVYHPEYGRGYGGLAPSSGGASYDEYKTLWPDQSSKLTTSYGTGSAAGASPQYAAAGGPAEGVAASTGGAAAGSAAGMSPAAGSLWGAGILAVAQYIQNRAAAKEKLRETAYQGTVSAIDKDEERRRQAYAAMSDAWGKALL
jgi:hypothetical protein